MLATITRILFCLALCLMAFSCSGCEIFCLGCQTCEKYQDAALVVNNKLIYEEPFIDSIIMKTNDSITGCGNQRYRMIGSKTHHVKFPINVRLQLFSQGDLWKEFFVKMDKNTVVKVYKKIDCSESNSPFSFVRSVESAKEDNRFIDSSLTDDYCWLLEKMDNSYPNDDVRCIELNVDGEQNPCGKLN